MQTSLEKRLENIESPTLKQELSQSVKEYPQTWKKYLKQLSPAIVISSLGAAAGQWAAKELGYDSNAAMTTAAYLCGYIPGYAYFFGSEYIINKKKYPRILSKEFGEFVGTFMAADYVSDITTFTPAFIASNFWLANNTEFHPAVRSLVAWNASALLYVSAISGLHPLTRRITASVNNGVKRFIKRVKGTK